MVLLNSPNTAFITAAPIGGGKVAIRNGIYKALGANSQDHDAQVLEKKISGLKIQEILIRELLMNPPQECIADQPVRDLIKIEAQTGAYVQDRIISNLVNYQLNQFHSGIIVIESLRTGDQVRAVRNRLRVMKYTTVGIFRDVDPETCREALQEFADEMPPHFQLEAAFPLWQKNAPLLKQAMEDNFDAFINFSDMTLEEISSDKLPEMISICLIEKGCATAVSKDCKPE